MQPNVPPETDNAVHEQVSGSVGGPGENSAECACGVMFDGFDTHAEAIAELNEHIATATGTRPSKLAAALEPGDWLAPFEIDAGAPAKVIGTFIYEDDGEPMRAIVFEGPNGGKPEIVYASPDEDIKLATAEERSATMYAGRRAKFVADLHSFADWFEARPWLPLCMYDLRADVQIDLYKQAGLDRVRQAAEELGVKPRVLDDRTQVGVDLSGVSLRLIAWHDKSEAADGGCE